MKSTLEKIRKNGPTVLVSAVVIGLAFPPLANWANTLMPVAVFIFILGSLLRVDKQELIHSAKNIHTSIIFPIFMVAACPYLIGTGFLLAGVQTDLALAIALAVAAPPASGNATIARMLGLDAPMAMVATFSSMAIIPITAPLIINHFGSESNISMSSSALALRLTLLIGGAGIIALLLKHYASAHLENKEDSIDGIVTFALFIFACGTMKGMQEIIINSTTLAITTILIAFLVNFILQIFGFICHPGNLRSRLSMGLTCGNRNIGLIWAVLGAGISPYIALFFACSQLPIQTTPKLLEIIIQKFNLINSIKKETQ